ncbi:MAG: endospore germination permease [Bacillota bacterium]
MRVERIANRQMGFIIFMIRTTFIIATLPVLTSGNAGQDAWASALLTLFVTVVIAVGIAALGARFPEMTVIEYSRKLLGKYLGGLISLGFLWLFLHIAATDSRLYAEVLVTGYLPNTPLLFIVSSMVVLASLIVYQGIESLGRLADALIFLFTAFVIASMLVAMRRIDAANLEPVLARGVGPVLSGTITPIAVGAQFIGISMLVPVLTAPKKAVSAAILAALLNGVVLVLAAVTVVGTLGPELGSRTVFPFFLMTRSLELAPRFLERVDVFGTIAWGFGLLIDVTLFLYCGSRGMSQLFGLRDYRPLVAPMAVVWALLAVHGYDDVFEVLALFRPEVIFPYITVIMFVPFLLLWAAYLIRRL